MGWKKKKKKKNSFFFGSALTTGLFEKKKMLQELFGVAFALKHTRFLAENSLPSTHKHMYVQCCTTAVVVAHVVGCEPYIACMICMHRSRAAQVRLKQRAGQGSRLSAVVDRLGHDRFLFFYFFLTLGCTCHVPVGVSQSKKTSIHCDKTEKKKLGI